MKDKAFAESEAGVVEENIDGLKVRASAEQQPAAELRPIVATQAGENV